MFSDAFSFWEVLVLVFIQGELYLHPGNCPGSTVRVFSTVGEGVSSVPWGHNQYTGGCSIL